MMRVLVAVVVLMLMRAPVAAQMQSQGAIIETLDDLKNKAEPSTTTRGLIPQHINLADNMPPPRSQADSSTCVSWAVTYAAASAVMRKAGVGDRVTLSPAFTYNQVSRDSLCRASTAVSKTLDLLHEQGALPIEEFAFNAGWCGRMPTDAERQRAAQYRINGWSRFNAADIDKVKEQLARGLPVIFSMLVGNKFNSFRGTGVFTADEGAINGHAMVAIGYDNSRQAFAIQNSAGRTWGDNGYAWLGYDFWKRSARVAYVIE